MNEPIVESVLDLPSLDPPENLWQSIRSRMDEKSNDRQQWIPASLAASIVVAALGVFSYFQLQQTETEVDDLGELLNEVAILEFNLLNVPRIHGVETPPQAFIGDYLYAIDHQLARPSRLKLVHRRELLERKRTLLKSYQLLQMDVESKRNRNAQFL